MGPPVCKKFPWNEKSDEDILLSPIPFACVATLLFFRGCFAPADSGFGTRADRPLDGDIEQRGLAAGQRSFKRRRKILGPFDEFTVTAKALDHLIVAGLQQVRGDRAAIKTQLNLPVDTPSRIVAQD